MAVLYDVIRSRRNGSGRDIARITNEWCVNSMEKAPKEGQIGCPFDMMVYACMQVEWSTEIEMAHLSHESTVHSKQRGPLRYLIPYHSLHLFLVIIFWRPGGFDAESSPLFSFTANCVVLFVNA